jgi:CBS domain-containing protein
MIRCEEIMKRDVRTVLEDTDVAAAARIMRDADVGLLPVLDAERGVVRGVLTDRDIVVRVCAAGLSLGDTTVAAVMTAGVVACRPDHTVAHAEGLMRSHRITRILVTTEDGALAGLLSLSDVAQYEPPSKTGRVVRDVAERKYAPERP